MNWSNLMFACRLPIHSFALRFTYKSTLGRDPKPSQQHPSQTWRILSSFRSTRFIGCGSEHGTHATTVMKEPSRHSQILTYLFNIDNILIISNIQIIKPFLHTRKKNLNMYIKWTPLMEYIHKYNALILLNQ